MTPKEVLLKAATLVDQGWFNESRTHAVISSEDPKLCMGLAIIKALGVRPVRFKSLQEEAYPWSRGQVQSEVSFSRFMAYLEGFLAILPETCLAKIAERAINHDPKQVTASKNAVVWGPVKEGSEGDNMVSVFLRSVSTNDVRSLVRAIIAINDYCLPSGEAAADFLRDLAHEI